MAHGGHGGKWRAALHNEWMTCENEFTKISPVGAPACAFPDRACNHGQTRRWRDPRALSDAIAPAADVRERSSPRRSPAEAWPDREDTVTIVTSAPEKLGKYRITDLSGE